MNHDLDELKKLYSLESKHSNYQILSSKLSQIIGSENLPEKSRFEVERLRFMLENIDVKNKSILDIGGNTGFFSLELLDYGAKEVHYYEGNPIHAEFVRLASKVLEIQEKIIINSQYYSFEDTNARTYDITLLLNVLHHIGDDYGDIQSKEDVQASIINQLNKLAKHSSLLVFQLGFNWKGNKELCMFDNGTKEEMINFIEEGIKGFWEITKIGIAERQNREIGYYDLNENNITREDHLGEFLNRPLFILKSLII